MMIKKLFTIGCFLAAFNAIGAQPSDVPPVAQLNTTQAVQVKNAIASRNKFRANYWKTRTALAKQRKAKLVAASKGLAM